MNLSRKIKRVFFPGGERLAKRSKTFGKFYKRVSWGYLKKKIGLNKLFGSPSSASSYNYGGAYGSTGSIIGRT